MIVYQDPISNGTFVPIALGNKKKGTASTELVWGVRREGQGQDGKKRRAKGRLQPGIGINKQLEPGNETSC